MFGALGSNDQYISDICYCHLLRTWSSKSTTWHMARHMLFFYWWLMPKILDMFGAKHLKKKFNNFILKRFFPLDNSNTRNLLVELLKSILKGFFSLAKFEYKKPILKGFDIWKRKSILNNKSQFVKVNILGFSKNQKNKKWIYLCLFWTSFFGKKTYSMQKIIIMIIKNVMFITFSQQILSNRLLQVIIGEVKK